jgi:hypothetical protein
MYYEDAGGVTATIYFNCLIVIGSYFLLNMFLAVIMATFSEMAEKQKA